MPGLGISLVTVLISTPGQGIKPSGLQKRFHLICGCEVGHDDEPAYEQQTRTRAEKPASQATAAFPGLVAGLAAICFTALVNVRGIDHDGAGLPAEKDIRSTMAKYKETEKADAMSHHPRAAM